LSQLFAPTGDFCDVFGAVRCPSLTLLQLFVSTGTFTRTPAAHEPPGCFWTIQFAWRRESS
jgi:hypothetical protein